MKADKFPCFKANAKKFEIKKRQNHYEITAITASKKEEEDKTVNFLDAAQGLKCWKQCKSDSGRVFVGYVKIKVETSNKSDQLLERYWKFLAELFETESIFVEGCGMGYLNNCNVFVVQPYNRTYYRTCIFTVIAGEVPTKEDMENLLDDCIILNTYNAYFTINTGFESIKTVCGTKCYDSCLNMSLNCKKDIVDKQVPFIAPLAIDELIKINTGAKKELEGKFSQNGFYPYNFIFTKLEKILKS